MAPGKKLNVDPALKDDGADKIDGIDPALKDDSADKAPDLDPALKDDGADKIDGLDPAVVYVANRPLLHNKKPYSIDADVTGLYEGEELERLLKMGVIKEA